MKLAGSTIGQKGDLIPVFECEFCGMRSVDKEEIKRCESRCYHNEEAIAGCL